MTSKQPELTHSLWGQPVRTWAVIFALMLVAALVRLYRLDTLPAGLHHDEASNGMLALQILAGDRPVFFSAYTGKEASYMYLVALCIHMSGQTTLAIRLPAALSGVLLVPLVFLAGRRIIGEWGALLAAGATTVAPWLLHINRIGFRANLLPLLLTLWVWLLLRGWETTRKRDWLLSGISLGLVAYTYTASRLVPILVVCFIGYLALWHRALLRKNLRGIIAMLLAATCVATPLFVHYLRTPADWGERLEQIGACSSLSTGACVVRMVEHVTATLSMVGWRGDPMGFFNLPDAPALPLAVGWLFYVGLVLALRRIREPAIALLLLWWLVLVLPGILSQDSPHFLRTFGAATPTMVLWALPLAAWQKTGGGERETRRTTAWFRVAGVVLVLLIAPFSIHDYFWRWATRPALYYDYMEYAVDAARAASTIPPDVDLVISEEYYRHPTYLYLAPRTAQARWFDARTGWPSAREGRTSVYLISPATPTDSRIDGFIQGAAGESILNAQGQWSYTRLTLPDTLHTKVQPDYVLHTRVGMLWFGGYASGAMQPDGTLPVTLFWRVAEPTNRNLRVFLHLVDQHGTLLAQHDALGYPSPEWQTGDRFVTLHKLPLAGTTQVAGCQIKLGLYDIETGERVQPDGDRSGEQAIFLPCPLQEGSQP